MQRMCCGCLLDVKVCVHAGPSQEELDRQEMAFVEDMFQLLQAAHFHVLSADEWATAQQESFTVCARDALVLCCCSPRTASVRSHRTPTMGMRHMMTPSYAHTSRVQVQLRDLRI